jgi:hypothetical protein
MERLTGAMHGRLSEVGPGLDAVARAQARLRAVGRAYVEFALAEPGLFRTAFSALAHASPVEPAGTAEEDQGPYALLNTVLDELVEVGYLAPERRPSADVTCWAGVHGVAVLHLDGPLAGSPPAELEASLSRFFDIVERGLGGEAG